MTERTVNVHIKNATINLTPPPHSISGAMGAVLASIDLGSRSGMSFSTSTFAGDEPEVRELCDGKEVTQAEALKALAELGDGWRLETPHELFSKVSYDYTNQHGALSRDESIKKAWYWTSQESKAFSGARVVVGFVVGVVDYDGVNYRCLARAVRVARQ